MQLGLLNKPHVCYNLIKLIETVGEEERPQAPKQYQRFGCLWSLFLFFYRDNKGGHEHGIIIFKPQTGRYFTEYDEAEV
ncbi:hypothetical protein J36TS2_00930 [Bacillus paralicheniformis]|nr:hypothetical protein J36TS2_00930 [Bacillus paralicheniformis]